MNNSPIGAAGLYSKFEAWLSSANTNIWIGMKDHAKIVVSVKLYKPGRISASSTQIQIIAMIQHKALNDTTVVKEG